MSTLTPALVASITLANRRVEATKGPGEVFLAYLEFFEDIVTFAAESFWLHSQLQNNCGKQNFDCAKSAHLKDLIDAILASFAKDASGLLHGESEDVVRLGVAEAFLTRLDDLAATTAMGARMSALFSPSLRLADLEWAIDHSRRRYRVRLNVAADTPRITPPDNCITIMRLCDAFSVTMLKTCRWSQTPWSDSDEYASHRLDVINRRRRSLGQTEIRDVCPIGAPLSITEGGAK
jgi:hypothetical protein